MEISAKQWWQDDLSGLKHLQDQHDQQSHAGGFKSSLLFVDDHVDNEIDIPPAITMRMNNETIEKLQNNISNAFKYLHKNEINEKFKVQVSDDYKSYGSVSRRSDIDKTIRLGTETALVEHPLFMAAVLFHESVHTEQDQGVSLSEKEFSARFKTKSWAQSKISKEGISNTEKEVLERIIRESMVRII